MVEDQRSRATQCVMVLVSRSHRQTGTATFCRCGGKDNLVTSRIVSAGREMTSTVGQLQHASSCIPSLAVGFIGRFDTGQFTAVRVVTERRCPLRGVSYGISRPATSLV